MKFLFDILCLCASPRVSRATNGHQLVPAKASGKWLVQPASCEAEAENNWDRPALPQQATGARVLHLTLPWGGRGKTSPVMPLCPNTGSTRTLQHTHTHSYTMLIHHLQMFVVYTTTHTHTHTHRIFIFILYCFVIYINTYINTVCLWLQEQRVKNHAKVEKATFLCCSCSLKIWMAEVLHWLSFLILGSCFVGGGEKKSFCLTLTAIQ